MTFHADESRPAASDRNIRHPANDVPERVGRLGSRHPAEPVQRTIHCLSPRGNRRRGAAGHVPGCQRRHLHQGGRRRRRPDRQGRAEHPEDVPRDAATIADYVGDLRRHGRGPVRVLRGPAGLLADPGQDGVRQRRPGLPADRADDRRDHRGDRHLRGRAAQERPRRYDRDQPRLLRLRRHIGHPGRDRRLHLPAGPLQRAEGRHGRVHPQPRRQPPAGWPAARCCPAWCSPSRSSC